MFDFLARAALAVALAGAAAPSVTRAAAGDDQYAVAAGHYARDRWQLAVTEFRAFRTGFPQHAKFKQAMFFEAEAHVQLGEFRPAVELFAEFVKRDPQSKYHRQALFRWGESLYFLEDNRAARPVLEEFRRTYAKDNLNAYVLAYLGQILYDAKDRPAAREYFETSLKEFPESQAQDECRFGLARIAEEEGDLTSAERTYLALGAKAGSRWADDAQFRLGALQYGQGDYQAALDTLESFEDGFKQSDLLDRARLSRGWALFKLDRLDDAGQLFASLQKNGKVGLEARYWLGLTQKAQKQWTAAAETLLAASRVDEKHELTPAIVYHAGDSLVRAGQRQAAMEQYDRLLNNWPQDTWADDALLGKLQLALGASDHQQVDALAREFQQQFAKSEFAPEARRIQAQSYLARKQFDAAQTLLKDATDSPPAALIDRYLRAAAQQGLAQHEGALQTLSPVLAQAAGQLLADSRLLQASLLVALNKHREAVQPLEAHLAADPNGADSARCRAQLAACYARAGELEKARGTFEAFLDQQPAKELRHSATQQLAEAVFAAGDYAWSGRLFESLTQDEPPAVAVRGLSGLAWSRYKAGESDAAAAAFQQVLDRFPDDPLAAEAALTRGQILQRQQPAAALAMYQRFIDKYPADKRLPEALLGAARVRDKVGQDQEAADVYARLAKEFPQHQTIDAALYEWAWVLRELHRADEADARFQSLYREHRGSRYWSDAVFRLAERAQTAKQYDEVQRLLSDLTGAQAEQKSQPHILYLQGQAAAGLQQWSEVIKFMQPLTEAAGDSPTKRLAEYWTAEALYRQGDYAAAGERLATLSRQTEDSREPWTAMVALRRAQVLAQQKKWKDAQDLAAAIAARWPQFDQQYEADYVVGRALAARGEFDDARAAYQRVIGSETGGKTETAAMAQWMIGESYFHQKNFELALREYLRLEILYDYPTWQAAALLQAGKCSEHLGQWKQAAELYQRVVKEFPETSFVDEAKTRLATARERLANR